MNTFNLERKRRILRQIGHKAIGVAGLARQFGVSEMTIRRDLADLENQGKLLRVHGGAIAREQLAYELSFEEKQARNSAAKKAIGEAAAALVRPADVVFIDTGSTALAVARAVRQRNPRVVVTSSIPVALEFAGSRDTRLLVTGGELSAHSPDLYGEWTVRILSDLSVDIAFLGCDAVRPGAGFYASDTRSAAVQRTVLPRAQASYVLADSSKFGKRAMCLVSQLAPLTGVITDAGLAPEHRKALEQGRVRLIVASDGGSQQ